MFWGEILGNLFMLCYFFQQSFILQELIYLWVILNEQMKCQVYFVSFFAYLTIHAMRMSIPFNQKPLADYYGLDNKMVGLVNSIAYILLGIAYMYRVIHPIKRVKSEYFYPITIACIFFILIPIYVFLGIKSIVLLFISMGAFGLFQSTSWPVVIKLIDRYFNAENDGFIIGIWSSNADIGNIFGFFICTAFIFYFHLRWQFSMIFLAISAFVFALLLFKLPIEETTEAEIRMEEPQYENLSALKTLFKKIKNPELLYLVVTLCLLKILLYGILLWLPLYLDRNGFQEFTGYIPIGFSVLTIVGSTFFGFTYQILKKPIFRSFMFIFINLLSVIAFWGIKITSLQKQNAWIILFLVGVTGFCIPAKFNVQISHETLLMCQKYGIEIVVWSSLMQGIGYTMVGIFQIIIGISTSINTQSIFIIFLITNILGLALQITHFIYQQIINHQQMDIKQLIEEQDVGMAIR